MRFGGCARDDKGRVNKRRACAPAANVAQMLRRPTRAVRLRSGQKATAWATRAVAHVQGDVKPYCPALVRRILWHGTIVTCVLYASTAKSEPPTVDAPRIATRSARDDSNGHAPTRKERESSSSAARAEPGCLLAPARSGCGLKICIVDRKRLIGVQARRPDDEPTASPLRPRRHDSRRGPTLGSSSRTATTTAGDRPEEDARS